MEGIKYCNEVRKKTYFKLKIKQCSNLIGWIYVMRILTPELYISHVNLSSYLWDFSLKTATPLYHFSNSLHTIMSGKYTTWTNLCDNNWNEKRKWYQFLINLVAILKL